jgi:hypothetical protein
MYAVVVTQARRLGYRVETLLTAEKREEYWLWPLDRTNWVTFRRGRSLDELKAELDAVEAGHG